MQASNLAFRDARDENDHPLWIGARPLRPKHPSVIDYRLDDVDGSRTAAEVINSDSLAAWGKAPR